MWINIDHSLLICILISSFSKMLLDLWWFLRFRSDSNSLCSFNFLFLLVLLLFHLVLFLLFNVRYDNVFLRVYSCSEIVDVKTKGVFFNLQLIITFCKISQNVTKPVFVGKVWIIYQLKLICLRFGIFRNSVKFDWYFLKTWTSIWEHSLCVEFCSNVDLNGLFLFDVFGFKFVFGFGSGNGNVFNRSRLLN